MVKVPSYSRQVGYDTSRIPNAPSVPRTDLSGGISAINKVGQANQELGETVGKIGMLVAKHAQERQLEIDNAEISAREATATTSFQDMFFSKEMETLNVNGQDIEMPKGYLNRQGVQADGITPEFDKQYGKLKNQFLSGLRTKEQYNALSKALDARYLSSRNTIINHEGDQFRKTLAESHEALAKQTIAGGAVVFDKDTLISEIDKLDGIYAKIGNVYGQDAKSIEFNQKDKAADLAQNSAESFLSKTGNLDGAIQLLDDVKDKILPDKYIDIKEKLKADKRSIDRLAKEQLSIQKDELYTKFFDGTLTLRDVAAVNKPIEQGGIGGKAAIDLKNKLIKAQNVELKDITSDFKSAEQYIQLVDSVVDDKINNFDLKQMAVDYYADGVIDSQEAKQVSNVKNILQDMKWNNASNPFVNSVKAIKSWFGARNKPNTELASALRTFFTSTQDIESSDKNEVLKKAQDVIIQQQIKDNPNLGMLPDVPNQTIKADGTLDENMPGIRNLKADASVSKKIPLFKDPLTNKKYRKLEDGTYQEVKK